MGEWVCVCVYVCVCVCVRVWVWVWVWVSQCVCKLYTYTHSLPTFFTTHSFIHSPPPLPQHTSVRACAQVFLRVHSPTFAGVADARFKHFVRHILPQLQREEKKRTLVFMPSYFDFARVRNFLRKNDVEFLQINDYSERSDVNRARTAFFDGVRPILLYTERYHYHNRPTIRNIRHIVFYEPPLFPQFYSEMINAINGAVASDATVTTLYSRFEADRLARIVGTQQAAEMLQSTEARHWFM